MDQLIEALNIFRKYGNPPSPTHCEHDTLLVMIDPDIVSEEDKLILGRFGFNVHNEFECFYSTRFGSA